MRARDGLAALAVLVVGLAGCALVDAEDDDTTATGDAAADAPGAEADAAIDAGAGDSGAMELFPGQEDVILVHGVLAMAILDVTGDGNADLVFSDDGRRLWYVDHPALLPEPLLLAGDLPFSLTTLVAADVDGDGGLDLVGAGGAQLFVALAPRAGALDPATHDLSLGSDIERLAIADLDRDGHVDLALMTAASSLFVVHQDRGGGGVFAPDATSIALGQPDPHVVLTDFDHDGGTDLVFAEEDASPRLLGMAQRPDAPGEFFPPQTLSETQGAYHQVTGLDLDGDGAAEIVDEEFGDTMGVYHFDESGEGYSNVQATLGGEALQLAAGDFDGRFQRDLVALVATSGQPEGRRVAIRLSSDPVFFHYTLAPPDQGFQVARALATGDLDDDGKDDVAVVGLAEIDVLLTRPPR